MSLLIDAKKESYRAQRTASQGAGVTLVSGCGQFTATFDCARHVASVLGNRELQDLGDGILEIIPFYKIPIEDVYSAIQKITTKYSVALVEYAMTKNGGQFVMFARINPNIPNLPSLYLDVTQPPTEKASTNLDDY